MKNILLLARKDLASLVNSWTGVLVFFLFFVLAGLFFSFLALSYARLSFDAATNAYAHLGGIGLTRFIIGSFLLNSSVLLVFLVPLVSMRSLAEERRSQTLELLYTYPFSDSEIVWGKYFGLLAFFGLMILPTLFYPALLQFFGAHLDWGSVASGYLGFFLLAAAYLAFGLFISSLTEHQMLSAAVTFAGLLLFWVFDWAANIADGWWAHFLTLLSPLGHYREFTIGILDLSHLAFFLFFQFYFLFLTLRSVETRNWKG